VRVDEPMRALLGRPLTRPPLVAVVHLPPSLSYAACPGVNAAVSALCEDVQMLDASGVDGILLENDADKPHTLTVNKAQVAWLTRLATEARHQTKLPLGIGVQRIDWEAALVVACAASLQLVRLDVFVDRVRMLGEEVRVSPTEVRALRSALRADAVEIWADVHVKHADLLSEGSLTQSTRQAADEGASAVSITGRRTGEPPTVADLDAARAVAAPAPRGWRHGWDFPHGRWARGAQSGRSDGEGMASSLRIAAVGEVALELFLPEGDRHLGGISANFARGVTAEGARGALFASVGDDARGEYLRGELERVGLDCLAVRVVRGRSAEQRIEVQPDGERRFVGFDAGVGQGYELNAAELAQLERYDAVAVPCSPESEKVFAQCLALPLGARLVADFSRDSPSAAPDRPQDWVAPHLARLEVAFVGGCEAFRAPLRELSRRGGGPIVLTAGAAGAFAFVAGQETHQASLADRVVDTTGCGDAFQAAFTVSHLRGEAIEDALRAGAALAARVAARRGSGLG